MRDSRALLRAMLGGASSIVLLFGCLLVGAVASAQEEQNHAATAVQEELAELRERVEELEAQRTADDEIRGAILEEDSWSARLPDLSIGGFANVDYQFSDEHERGSNGGSSNHFVLGDLDLFLVSQLSERISFLSEILLEFDSDGDTTIDVERLLLRYEHADWLKASLGRGHTPIGYWNTAYHHGTWLWTTIRRPVLFEFEDEGGILPLHFVGLAASGHVESSAGLLSYQTVVSNGRGKEPDDIQLTDDVNDTKRVAAQFAFQPRSLPDLRLGINGLYDDIPRDSSVPGRESRMDEWIAGGQVIYASDPLELYVEGQWVRHDGGGRFHTYGGYAQVAYRIGKFKPYFRFDWLSLDDSDPFFAQDPDARDQRQYTVGLRFDWQSFAAIKLEYRHLDADDPRGGRRAVRSETVAAQLAVAF